MRLNITARLDQHQILAPQLILSMNILQLNSLDLEARIQKEFLENPALEVIEPSPAVEEEATESPDQEREVDPEVQRLLEIVERYERGEISGKKGLDYAASDAKQEALLNHASRSETLEEFLLRQLGFVDLDSELRTISEAICGNLDRRGYLIGDLPDLAQSLGVSVENAERCLAIVQALDPPGVGARDLRDCLLLQLKGDCDATEYRVISDHLGAFMENHLPRIASALKISLDELQEACDLIRQLDPSPGASFSDDDGGLVVPELELEEIEGKLVVRLLEERVPEVRISPVCVALLKEEGQSAGVLDFVRKKVESARWLIHALDQRHRTLRDIAQAVVDHQKEYFVRGPGHLRALTMQVIADQTGVNISTVSRAANGKYIQTPFGAFELRRFFTGGVERADGGIESRENVCTVIEEIVGEEDSRYPLSDNQLARKLQARGIEIARRTVSKYRERAGIPQARLRKRFK